MVDPGDSDRSLKKNKSERQHETGGLAFASSCEFRKGKLRGTALVAPRAGAG
jgi:hypothetical protein